MRFIKPTRVRRLAHELGRRCPKAWLLWLDGRVEQIVSGECAALGSRKTLRGDESELRRQVNRRR